MKALNKDILREIRKSKGRVISILLMVSIGVLIFVGLKITSPIMAERADDYFRETNGADIIVSSTYGLEDEDIEIIKNSSNIDNIETAYNYDVETKDKEKLIRLNSITKKINTIKITEGKLPKSNEEIVLNDDLKDEYSIGDYISFAKEYVEEDEEYSLENYKYKIVGFATSPDYVDSINLGNSLIGDGIIKGLGFINEDNFNLDNYSVAKITFKDLKNLNFSNENYKKIAKEHKNNLEDALSSRKREAFDDKKAEVSEKIKEGEKEILDAKNKISDTEKELKDAKKKIEDGYSEYNKGKLELISSISKAKQDLIAAQSEITKNRTELESKRAELTYGETEILKAQVEIDSGRAQLDSAWEIYNSQVDNLNSLIAISNGEIERINNNIQELLDSISNLPGVNNSRIEELKSLIKKEQEKIEDFRKSLDELKPVKSLLEQQEKTFVEGKKEFEAKKAEFEAGKREFQAGEKALIEAQAQIDSAYVSLDEEQSKGELKLEEGLSELEKNEKLLEENEELFKGEKEKAEKDIAEAEEKLNEARRALNALMAPRYTVDSRESNSNIYTFYDEAERLGIISNVFPVFFFFIALLVSLTTMTRMVDEQRLEIGTLKALGYSNSQIMKKYFIYGGVASVLGSILGIFLGHKLISPLIFTAYASNYVFDTVNIPFNFKYSLLAFLIGVLCTAVAGAIASRDSLRDNAAILMRGKPPRSGTRIFLERITVIWKRLSFMHKVTMRNLFRYKRRMFMTIIGISGCTGLIFMGFGIKDSITSMENKQYHQIFNYDIISVYNEDFSPSGFEKYEKIIANKKKIKKETPVNLNILTVDSKVGPDNSVTLITPKESNKLDEFIKLRGRKNQKKIKLTDKGAVISEKLADLLDIKAGEEISVKDENGDKFKIRVVDITENYAGHYLYMTSGYYENIFNKDYEVNGNILQFNTNKEEEKSEITEEINNNDAVLSVYNNNQLKNMIDNLLGTLDVLVFVIISCSCILAFVVLYNLTNINVSERIRELSTIKVLGFYDKEVTAYVYRETFILTIFGIFAGYLIGFLMHYIIINNLIPDTAMLDPHLYLTNFITSGVITILFAVVVMLVVHRKLKNINMVEALKAVE